jgi:protein phosphatase
VTRFDQIEHAAETSVGVRRSHNQDSHTVLLAPDVAHWQDHGHVFLVADGMGAHAVGELASEMACNIIPLTYQKHAPEGIVPALQRAFTEANASIFGRGVQNPEFKGMGTTSTAVILRPEGAWIGHVGDSRAYRIRGGSVQQLSFDHSLLWEKARRQHVSPEEMQGVPSNVIVRSLGPEENVEVDVHGPHPLEPGDSFLLCSDGLSGQVSDEEIGAAVSALPPAEACHFLISMANLRGGPDNITVIIARVTKPKGSGESEEAAPKAPPWYTRVPWPLLILLMGVGLAGYAVSQLVNEPQSSAGKTTFIWAAIVLVVGLVALVANHFLDKYRRATAKPVYRARTKVYREADCRISRKMLEELKEMEESLTKQSQENKWEIDWDTHKKHNQICEQQLGENRFGAAYREKCRALKPLFDALDRSRNKEEAFQPNWEKKKKGGHV